MVDDALRAIEAPDGLLGPVLLTLDRDGDVISLTHIDPKQKFSRVGPWAADELRSRDAVAYGLMTPVWATVDDYGTVHFKHVSRRLEEQGREMVFLGVGAALFHVMMTKLVTRFDDDEPAFGPWVKLAGGFHMEIVPELVKGVCPQG